MPEAWLEGPVEGVPDLLMPVAHALVQARREVSGTVADLTPEEVWTTPGGAASIGFHLHHIVGATDRLLTYAEGGLLSDAQMDALRTERDVADEAPSVAALLERLDETVERVLGVLRDTDESTLRESREVGRARLPSTVLGLLFHIGEHAQRHVGQIATTAILVRGERRGAEA